MITNKIWAIIEGAGWDFWGTFIFIINSVTICLFCWGSIGNGDTGFEELGHTIAYKIGLRTWAT